MDKNVVVTVGGVVETLDEVLARVPNADVVVWVSPYNYSERSAFGQDRFFSILTVKTEGIEVMRTVMPKLGCLQSEDWCGDPFRVWLSPAEVVAVLESHGFEISRDEFSRRIIENTK